MTSSLTGGIASVPEGRVKQFEANGWVAEKAPAKRSAPRAARKSADDDE